MKPYTLTILLAFIVLAAKGQSKWTESGYSEYKDTTTKTFSLKGKDSLTYTIETQNCNCDFYTTIGDHKLHSCKGLKLHSIEVHWNSWCKDVTYVKGIKIVESKPRWESNWGQQSTVDGIYEQNGSVAYIHSIHLLKYKLINRTQPYKFADEWIILNEY